MQLRNLSGADFADVSMADVGGHDFPRQPFGNGVRVTFSVSWHAVGRIDKLARHALVKSLSPWHSVHYRHLDHPDRYELVTSSGEVLGGVTRTYKTGPKGGQVSEFAFTWKDQFAAQVTDRVVTRRYMREIVGHARRILFGR